MCFQEVLKRVKKNTPGYLSALWLLNIAYMTIGAYPDGVPEQYRIPYEVFASEDDFPRFENIATEAGVGSWSLFGGVVTDDFDGDGWLDAVVTTSDVREQIRFFHNNGNGTFAERTEEAGLEGLVGGLNVIQADYDNDGDLDVFVLRGAWLSAGGKQPSSLLRNEGGGRSSTSPSPPASTSCSTRRRPAPGPTTTTTATSTSTSGSSTATTSSTDPASSGATAATALSRRWRPPPESICAGSSRA